MNIRQIKKLCKQDKLQEALSQVDSLLSLQTESPYLWNLRGDLLQMQDTMDGPPLEESARCYLKALELNANDLEAMESLAHFYDAVNVKPAKAKKFAKAYIEKTKTSIRAMERILRDE